MRNYEAESVDAYIENAVKEAQPKLKELREVVKSAVPGAEESISWGVPFYKYYGLLAGFSFFKKHVSFGFTFALDSEVRKSLKEKGYDTGSKTIQIKFDQEIPKKEIQKILKDQAKKNEINQR